MLRDLVNSGFLDYVAMDIKLPKEKYPIVFSEAKNIEDIKKSVEFLKNPSAGSGQVGKIDFEFRTTAVPGVHEKKDFLEIAKWIGGPNIKYYLQNFRAEKTIDPEFEKIKPLKKEFLDQIAKEISPYFKLCQLRDS